MRFNSLEFVIFFGVVFLILWRFNKSLKVNNILLLVVSYIFYGWWDYRFLFLILISSVVDFAVGYYLPESKRKKLLVGISIAVNIGLLMFFKYFNFFIEATVDLLGQFGVSANHQVLNIILPVGISFYTFQTLSYSLDVYRGRMAPEKDFVAFLSYVSFFPQLVAGPIERGRTFLPQFRKKRQFNFQQAVEGMRLILYGFFKKMVIADNVGLRVDMIYSDPAAHSSMELFLGGCLFFVQLYADFSAYTDIARGGAKLLGFELMRNFRTPQFATSIPDLWSRWHISLTTWFRDYLYVWLAGIYRNSTVWRVFATVILMLVIGLWHGANYTFVLFGVLNGLYFIPRILSSKNKSLRRSLKFINTHPVVSKFTIMGNFILSSMTIILFRVEDINMAGVYFSTLVLNGSSLVDQYVAEILPLCLGFFAYEWIMRKKDHPFDVSGLHPVLRRFIYVGLIIAILLFGYFGEDPFYYFQF